jgi:hypothetical protein
MSTVSYSCWPVFAILYNLPPSLCMKYEYMFLCLNVMLKPLIEELKQLWEGVKAYDYDQKQKFSLRVVYLWSVHDFMVHNIFFKMELQWNSDISDMYEGHILFSP